MDAVGVAGSSLTSFGTEASSSGTLSPSSAVGSAFAQDTRSVKPQLARDRSSPQLDPLRKSSTTVHAASTVLAHLPGPASVGRRSRVLARPLPDSQKATDGQEHREAEVYKVPGPEQKTGNSERYQQAISSRSSFCFKTGRGGLLR